MGGIQLRFCFVFFQLSFLQKWQCGSVSIPSETPREYMTCQNIEHGYELRVCVEGIQARFCFDNFSFKLPTKLCLCGSVSVPLRDPQGVFDCQNMVMNCMVVWRASTGFLSDLRTALPKSRSRPVPAYRPNHAT